VTEEELIQQFKQYRDARNKHRWTALLSAIGGRQMPSPMQQQLQQGALQNQVLQEMHESGRVQQRGADAYDRALIQEQQRNYRKQMDYQRALMQQRMQNSRAAASRELRMALKRYDALNKVSGNKIDPQVKMQIDTLLRDYSATKAGGMPSFLAMVREENPRVTDMKSAVKYGLQNPDSEFHEGALAEMREGVQSIIVASGIPATQRRLALQYFEQQLGGQDSRAMFPEVASAIDALNQEADAESVQYEQAMHEAEAALFPHMDQSDPAVPELRRQHAAMGGGGGGGGGSHPTGPHYDRKPDGSLEYIVPPSQPAAPAPEGTMTPDGGAMVDGATYSPDEVAMGDMGVDLLEDPQSRSAQLFDQIEAYSSEPKYAQMRNELMGSEDFQQYKRSRGYQNDDFAFKEWGREMKRKYKDSIKEDKRRKRQNMQAGLVAGVGPQRGVTKPPPVFGGNKTATEDV
jgi:hypothetical protein